MVGVAGKSRACHDCKRRRVKCDYQRPTCSRCDKAGRHCSGYDKASIFVNRTIRKPSTTAPAAIAEAISLGVQPISKPISILLQVLKKLQQSIPSLTSASPVIFRRHAWEILKEQYLPRDQPTEEPEITTTCYSWVHAVCELSADSRCLDQALLAFCAIQVYLAEPWSISQEHALQVYNESTQELVRCLSIISEQAKDETLAAIVVLSTCELFILRSDESWQAHAHGISELLRSRACSHDRTIVWRRLCSRLRLICVIIALAKGQSLTLDPEVWRQLVPVDDTVKSLETLMDIVTEVPHLLGSSNELSKPEVSAADTICSLLTAFRKIATWQKWSRMCSTSPPYWAVPARVHNPSDDSYANRLFPFALEYESLHIAMLFIFSSAVMLQLLAAALSVGKAAGIEQDFDDSKSSTIDQQHEDYSEIWSMNRIRSEADKIARFICQSTEYCFRLEMGTVGAQAMCHPKFVVQEYFRQVASERELDWCRNIRNMDGHGVRRGIEMMLFGGDANDVF